MHCGHTTDAISTICRPILDQQESATWLIYRLTLDQVCWSILGRLSTGIVADMLIDISVDTSIDTPQKIHDHNTDLPGSGCNVVLLFS